MDRPVKATELGPKFRYFCPHCNKKYIPAKKWEEHVRQNHNDMSTPLPYPRNMSVKAPNAPKLSVEEVISPMSIAVPMNPLDRELTTREKMRIFAMMSNHQYIKSCLKVAFYSTPYGKESKAYETVVIIDNQMDQLEQELQRLVTRTYGKNDHRPSYSDLDRGYYRTDVTPRELIPYIRDYYYLVVKMNNTINNLPFVDGSGNIIDEYPKNKHDRRRWIELGYKDTDFIHFVKERVNNFERDFGVSII